MAEKDCVCLDRLQMARGRGGEAAWWAELEGRAGRKLGTPCGWEAESGSSLDGTGS